MDGRTDKRQHLKVTIKDNLVYFQIPYELRMRVNMCAKWHKEWKCWSLPLSSHAGWFLCENFHTDHPELLRLRDSYLRALEVKHSDYKKLPEVPNINITAWPHQKAAYHIGMNLRNFLLAMAMGTGKSLVATSVAANLPNNSKILIVCPKSVIPVWPKEMSRAKVDFNVFMYNTKSLAQRALEMRRDYEICKQYKRKYVAVVNYEAFWQGALGKTILKLPWNVFILDECHRIKSHSGMASKFAFKLSKQVKSKIGLSGTPLPHSPLDIFAQYRTLDWSVFGQFITGFKKKYVVTGGFQDKNIVGFKNKQELSDKIHAISFWVQKDVLDLPELIIDKRYGELDKNTAKIYNAFDKKLFIEIEQHKIKASNVMVKMLRLQQITSGFANDSQGNLVHVSSAKLNTLKDLLQDFPLDEPLVIFCVFTEEIAQIKAACEKMGRSVAELSGKVNELASWQGGEKDVLITQIRAGSEGVDMTRSHYTIYYSVGFSYGTYQQSLSRCHRPGQTKTTFVYHLVMRHTIDELVYRSLQNKEDVINDVVNKGRTYDLSPL